MTLTPTAELRANLIETFPSQALLDTIKSSICILNSDGIVIAKNAIWPRLGFDNGSTALDIGQSYFEARLQSNETRESANEFIVESIKSIIDKRSTCFVFEYECLSSENPTWFELTATPLILDLNTYVVLNHRDVTANVLSRQSLHSESIETAKLDFESKIQNQELTSLVQILGRSHAIVEYALDGTIKAFNDSFVQKFGFTESELVGQSHRAICCETFIESGKFDELWAKLNRGEFDVVDQGRFNSEGEELWIQSTYHPVFTPEDKLFKVVEYSIDISDRRELQKDLEAASRTAGMAEIATGVLHNVGNVLNSVNVAANLLLDKLKNSPIDKLSKAAQILNENIDNLGHFMTHDVRGRHFPMFLTEFLNFLQENRQTQIEELTGLLGNVEHIKKIISFQQSFGKSHGHIDSQNIVELIEESIELNQLGFKNYNIRIDRNYAEVPAIETEKHRVMQILVNLIKNGQQAIRDAENINNEMFITIDSTEELVSVRIKDNGIGISEESAKKIFGHGFTTKKDGHGFGLHSCANSAQELGGSLTFESEGLGQGATFILTLPFKYPHPATTKSR